MSEEVVCGKCGHPESHHGESWNGNRWCIACGCYQFIAARPTPTTNQEDGNDG